MTGDRNHERGNWFGWVIPETPNGESEMSGKGNGKPDKGLPDKLAGKLPTLIPQPNGGALLSGGIPGHPGTGGRPPDVVKAIARHLFAKRLPRLARIADGTEAMKMTVVTQMGPMEVDVKPNFGQQIKAHEVLAANAGLNEKDGATLNLQVNIVGGGLALIKIEGGGNGS